MTISNEGVNIPNVATIAPGSPYKRYPTKVAVITIGPGVT